MSRTVSGTESVVDYSRFDFAAAWSGRDRVTEVERAVVREAFSGRPPRRILEAGAGFGRLTPALTGLGAAVIAVDVDRETLARTAPLSPAQQRVAANLYHLPFRAGAFDGASLVRVYHHLSDPARALRELARVVGTGGRVVVSYAPAPSVGTLVQDVRRALLDGHRGRSRSITFSAVSSTPVAVDPFPIFVAPRRETRERFAGVGLALDREVVTGLEEFPLLDRIPAGAFVRLGTALSEAPGFPVRFAVLSVPGRTADRLPADEEVWACPRCADPLRVPDDPGTIRCDACAYVGERTATVVDLRYIPPGTPRYSAVGSGVSPVPPGTARR